MQSKTNRATNKPKKALSAESSECSSMLMNPSTSNGKLQPSMPLTADQVPTPHPPVPAICTRSVPARPKPEDAHRAAAQTARPTATLPMERVLLVLSRILFWLSNELDWNPTSRKHKSQRTRIQSVTCENHVSHARSASHHEPWRSHALIVHAFEASLNPPPPPPSSCSPNLAYGFRSLKCVCNASLRRAIDLGGRPAGRWSSSRY